MKRERVKNTIMSITSVVIVLLVLFISMPKLSEKIAEESDIESYIKTVGQGSLVTVDGITDTGVTLTGSERTDIVNVANSQLGVVEDYSDAAEYYTKYNRWYWEFVNIRDASGKLLYDPWGWSDASKKTAQVAKTSWCYFFLGWAADAAQCNLTVYKANKGFFIDGQVARSYNTGGDPGWYKVHKRAFEINSTKDVIENTIPGDLVVGKSATGNGNHHIFMVSENNGTTLKTIEGNINSEHPRVVASRTMTSTNSKVWNNIELLYYYKPMYRSTATFNTNGAVLISMPPESEGETWFDTGVKKGGKYYKYKFYDDRNYYTDSYSSFYDYVPLPDADDLSYEGYRFGGWYDNPEFAGNAYTKMPTVQIGNIDFYARWEKQVTTESSNATSKTIDGIKLTKKASWTMYEGKNLSENGNPYIKIEFEVDPTKYFENNPSKEKIATEGAAYFVDKIPEEMDLAMGMYSEFERISASEGLEIDTSLYAMEKKLYFRFDNGIENKKYNASFVVEVSKDELLAEIIAGHRKMNTNGESANEGTDAFGSAYFTAEDTYIEISSPQLDYKEIEEGTDGVTSSMTTKKSASLGMYEGSYYDELGNPYVDIEFTIDLSGVSTENMQKDLELVDYIPNEYDYIAGSLEASGEPTSYIYNSAKNTIECKWSDDTFGLQGKIFYIKFKTKLNFNNADMNVINTNKRVFTNGKTIDITKSSQGAATVKSTSFDVSLQSPMLDISDVVSKVYNVKLHTNGGLIQEGKDITRYTAGKEVMLPTQMHITKDGYTFAGWYDNEALIGKAVLSIPTTAKGDLEFWAKWVDQSVGATQDGIELSKESMWKSYDGKLSDENGNPYVKTEITVDMTRADVENLVKIPAKKEPLDLVIAFEQSVNMRGDALDSIFKYLHGHIIETLMSGNENVRVAIAGYGGTVNEIVTLDQSIAKDSAAIKTALDNAYEEIQEYYDDFDKGYYDTFVVGNNMQAAILWAQRQFTSHSTDAHKEFILLSNRCATEYASRDVGADCVQHKDDFYNKTVGKYYNDLPGAVEDCTYDLMALSQMEYMKSIVSDLYVITYDMTNDSANDFWFKNLATDEEGYYNNEIAKTISINSIKANFSDALDDIFANITQRLGLGALEFKFVDYVPDAYTVLNDTFATNGPINMTLDDDNVITAKFDLAPGLEKKIYTIEFYTKLSINKLPSNVVSMGGEIYTNGKTLDVSVDSLGSAYFEYGDNKIELESPTVIYNPEMVIGKIGFNKDAHWTTYNGAAKDTSGNPYLKTTFKIDLTKTDLKAFNTLIENSGTTDVVFLLDVSNSIELDKLRTVMDSAKSSMTTLLNECKNVRIAMAGYGGEIEEVVKFNDDYTTDAKVIGDRIDALYGKNVLLRAESERTGVTSAMLGATDIQGSLIWAQRQLTKYSTADNKLIVFIGDGRVTDANLKREVGNDIAKVNDDYYYEASGEYSDVKYYEGSETSDELMALAQKQLALSLMPNLEIVTIGVELDDEDKEISNMFLSSLATKDKNGEAWNYDVTADGVAEKLANIVAKISTNKNFKVVDLIPDEFTYMEGSIVCSNKDMICTFVNNKLVVDISKVELENKVYSISFVTKFDKSSVTNEMIENKEDIYTNGTSIDVSKDSKGSSYLEYDGGGKIELDSPKVSLDFEVQNDDVVLDKTSKWASYEEKTFDDNGNPYVKTTFTLDLRNADIDIFKNTVLNAQSNDVMFLIDVSSSMRYDKIEQTIIATKNAITKILSENSGARVSVKLFGGYTMDVVTFSQSISNNPKEINRLLTVAYGKVLEMYEDLDSSYGVDGLVGLTDMKYALVMAQREFVRNSTAKDKTLLVLSDGVPYGTPVKTVSGNDVVTASSSNAYYNIATSKYTNVSKYANSSLCMVTLGQMEYMKENIDDLNVVTVGVNLDEDTDSSLAKEYMKSLATSAESGNPWFYDINISVNDIIDRTFKNVMNTIKSENKAVLTDLVPSEYDILGDTVKINNANVDVTVGSDKIIFDFAKVDFVKQTYTIEFYSTLDVTKVPEELQEGTVHIYSNGTTLDTQNDSLGSAYFEYGANGKVELRSPKLLLNYQAMIDRVSMTKSAKWSPYDGKDADAEGNLYSEIEFNVDFTSADLENLKNKSTTMDMIILMDISQSTLDTGAADYEMRVVKEFIGEFLGEGNSDTRRVAVGGFEHYLYNFVNLNDSISNNATKIVEAMDEGYNEYLEDGYPCCRNMQYAIYWAQTEFINYSKADKKIIVVFSNGRPEFLQLDEQNIANGYLELTDERALELWDNYDQGFADYGDGSYYLTKEEFDYVAGQVTDLTKRQMDYAKSKIEGLEVIGVGVDLDNLNDENREKSIELLEALATTNPEGDKYVYKAKVDTMGYSTNSVKERDIMINSGKEEEDEIVGGDDDERDIVHVLEDVLLDINGMFQFKVVDFIPEEFELEKDSIKVSDENVTYAYSEEDRTLEFNFDMDSIENKSYKFTFTIKLVLQRVSEDILANNDYIYTNGKTIDVTKDSIGSSYFEYGDKRINLESPKVTIGAMYNVILHTNGGVIADGRNVTKYIKGVGITLPTSEDIEKSGYTFEGWYDNEDFNGEPIVKIPSDATGDKEYWAKWKQKNTNITKSANWTTYEGNEADESGNPYAEIKFNVDLTAMNFAEIADDNTMDVVFIMDYSETVLYQEGYYTYTAVSNFAKEFLKKDGRRVAVAGYRDKVREAMTLDNENSSNGDMVDLATYALFNYYNIGEGDRTSGKDIMSAVIWAQRQLINHSTADKKFIIIMSNGAPTLLNNNEYTGEDVVEVSEELQEEIGKINSGASVWTDQTRQKVMDATLEQIKYAKDNIEDLDIISIGVNLDDFSENEENMCQAFLKSMATKGVNDKKNYYSTFTKKLLPESISINSGKEEEEEIKEEKVDLLQVAQKLSFELENILKLVLVDFIPQEFELIEDSITSSDSSIRWEVYDGKVVFTFNYETLEKKVYTFSFIEKLHLETISKDVFNNCDEIYTNGDYVDSRLDSIGSSYFQYGKERVDLDSPKISFDFYYDVKLHTNGGLILAGKDVTQYRRGTITFLPTEDDIVREGYTFEGWYDNEDFSGEAVEFIPASASGDKEYWAKWKAVNYLKIKKSAEWTTMGGMEADVNGNPYAKIQFNVDLTNADPETYFAASEVTTDVIVLLDSSKAVYEKGFADEAITAVGTFAENLMVQNDKSRVAIGMFGESVLECVGLNNADSKDINGINEHLYNSYMSLNDMYNSGLMSDKKDIQSAIIWAQRQLNNYSDADRKVILVFSHGEGNVANYAGDTSDDVIKLFNNINGYSEFTEQVQENINTQTLDQMEYARNSIEGLATITIGMSFGQLETEKIEARSTIFMRNLASLDDTGNRMFYIADVGNYLEEASINSVDGERKITINAGREEDDQIVRDEEDTEVVIRYVIDDILKELTGNIAIRLVDKIPSEFGLFKSSIVKSDNKVKTKVSGNVVQFDFPIKDVEQKMYTFTFTIKLFRERVSRDIIDNNDYIYTNGTTIDVRKNSKGSSYITFGKTGKIELESPKIELRLYHKVTLHPNGGTILAGKDVTFYREGVGVMLPKEPDIFKEHYDFAGWYDNPEFTGTPKTNITSSETGDKEYWAKWTPKIYNVTLHPNGGVYEPEGMGEVTHYTYGIGTPLPNGEDISKDGFDFVGWYDNEGLTGTAITEITPTDSGDKEYWAKWERITITIENSQESIYIAVGYDDLFKVGDIEACFRELSADKVTSYITKGVSKTSRKLTGVKELQPYIPQYFNLPRDLFEYYDPSKKEDQFVYLHYLWGANQRTIKIRLRVSVAFEEH